MTSERSPSIIPGLRYEDAPAAIEWLCEAFGFKKHMEVEGESDMIPHARLVYGNGMIMLGSVREDDFSESPYIIVADADDVILL